MPMEVFLEVMAPIEASLEVIAPVVIIRKLMCVRYYLQSSPAV